MSTSTPGITRLGRKVNLTELWPFPFPLNCTINFARWQCISVRMRLAECLLDVGRAAEARSNLRAVRDLLDEPDPLIEAALAEAEAELAAQRSGRAAESPAD